MINFLQKIICNKCNDYIILFDGLETKNADKWYKIGFEEYFLYFYNLTKSNSKTISPWELGLDYKNKTINQMQFDMLNILENFGFKNLLHEAHRHSCINCYNNTIKNIIIKDIIE